MEPLASKIRPKSLEDFIGQEHLVGKTGPLRIAVEKKHLFSFIFWGPPGVGKTTLAKIYAKALDADFYELSAVSAGKDDIRKIIRPAAEIAMSEAYPLSFSPSNLEILSPISLAALLVKVTAKIFSGATPFCIKFKIL